MRASSIPPSHGTWQRSQMDAQSPGAEKPNSTDPSFAFAQGHSRGSDAPRLSRTINPPERAERRWEHRSAVLASVQHRRLTLATAARPQAALAAAQAELTARRRLLAETWRDGKTTVVYWRRTELLST